MFATRTHTAFLERYAKPISVALILPALAASITYPLLSQPATAQGITYALSGKAAKSATATIARLGRAVGSPYNRPVRSFDLQGANP